MIRSNSKLRIIVLSCRPQKNDFRIHLADAFRQAGYETLYISTVDRGYTLSATDLLSAAKASFIRLIALVRHFTRSGQVNLLIDSTNTSSPFLILLFWLSARRTVWCFDMHDDLLYDAVGLHRLYNRISQLFHTKISDTIFTSAPTLNGLFSQAIHIGNASHITRTSRQKLIVHRVLILSSLDERFDFKLLLAVATDCAAIVFDIYGHIHRNDRIIRAQIEGLVTQRGNIKYHGPYVTSDIESLVRKYDVSFAPYRTGVGLTKHIDPLRFYHCLNAGMEVLTTDIPAIKHFSNAVHIIRGPNDFRDTIGRLGTARGARKNIGIQYKEVTWADRGRQIIDATKVLPKFQRLIGESP